MKKVMLIVVLVLFLSGCATQYQSSGLTGGHSETQLGENVFQVSFQGNAYTRADKAADYTLLRSAEVAMENGFNYFIIVESGKDSVDYTYTAPTEYKTTGTISSSGISNSSIKTYNYNAKTKTSGGQTFNMSKPSATNTIVCYKEKPQISGLVYEAKYVSISIKDKYSITN